MIDVGAAVRPLGISSPVPMSGFAARTRPSTGEHDELGARALAMDDVVFIALDVCALEEGTCRAIADGVLPRAPEQVIVTATHTHSGPCSTPTRLTRCTPQIERTLISAAVAAGRAARDARVSCTVEHRAARGVGVASNRRHAGRPVDPPVQMVRFLAIDGQCRSDAEEPSESANEDRVVAALLTFPCHPVVLDGSNLELSGDYVHPLRTRVEAAYPGAVAVFATGCAGDINTGHSAEASYSLDRAPDRTYAEAHRVGTRIADAALTAEPTALREMDGAASPVAMRSEAVTLAQTRPDPDRLAADRAAWSREVSEADAGRAALLNLWIVWAEGFPDGSDWSGRVSAVRVGPVTLVMLPGEPFLAVADQINSQLDGPSLVLGYADGCPGYFPTADEYPHGGYEVEDAHRYYGMPGPFTAGAAEVLIEKAVNACRALG